MAYTEKRKNFVHISDKLRDALQAEIDRTGLGAFALFKAMQKAQDATNPETTIPKTLNTYQLIKSWQMGKVKTAEPEVWQFVIKFLEAQPNTLLITPKMRSNLQAEMDRMGLGAFALFNAMQKAQDPSKPETTMPKALNVYYLIENWRMGNSKSAEPKAWQFVMTFLKERERVTPHIAEEIETYATKQSRGSLLSVFRAVAVDPKQSLGLEPADISNIFNKKTKLLIRRDDLNAIRQRFAPKPAGPKIK